MKTGYFKYPFFSLGKIGQSRSIAQFSLQESTPSNSSEGLQYEQDSQSALDTSGAEKEEDPELLDKLTV